MNRLKVIFIFYLLFFLAIIFRLFHLQVLSPNAYSGNYTKTQKINPVRGVILDALESPIAVNQTKYLLYASPKKITNKEYVVKAVDNVLQLGEATISARIDTTKNWVAIKGNLTKEVKEQIEKLKIDSLGFQEEEHRFYPEASLSAHLIGFLGKDADSNPIGYFGVEGFYNRDLAGMPGIVKSERDLFGRPIFVGNQERLSSQNGRNLKLSVHKSIQVLIKEKLIKTVDKFKAVSGCVIVANPNTMGILGMVCIPDYDPETYFKYENNVFSNFLVSGSYEPGSTFKPLILASALEEGVLKETDTFNETGPVKIADYAVSNWNDKYDGEISFSRVIEKSSNVGMVEIGRRLGNKKLYEYIANKFQFGALTGIDLQGESAGKIREQANWYPIDYATATFGQGVSVTGIQLITAFSSVINGGYLLKPYVVEEIIDELGEKKREKEVKERIFSQKTSDTMKKVLGSTIQNAEAKWKIPEGYSFGGKTGTAQIAVSGRYDETKTIASFIGFAPLNNPAYIMLVIIVEPSVSSWGSETAAPLFFDISKDLLLYLNISPE